MPDLAGLVKGKGGPVAGIVNQHSRPAVHAPFTELVPCLPPARRG